MKETLMLISTGTAAQSVETILHLPLLNIRLSLPGHAVCSVCMRACMHNARILHVDFHDADSTMSYDYTFRGRSIIDGR